MDIQEASNAVDLFGPITTDPKLRRAARRKYRMFLHELRPDQGHNKDLFQKLQGFWEAWESGKSAPAPKTAAYSVGKWELRERIAQGTISNVYRTQDPKYVLKIVRKPHNSSFLERERDSLMALQTAPHPELYPLISDNGRANGREFNVLESLETGWHTLTEVLLHRVRTRLSGADYAWMHRRLLGALAGAHQQGLVHGAVLPDNIMIQPASHGVKLIGWSFSGKPGAPCSARANTWAPFYPRDTVLSEGLDVYMAHSVMQWALAPAERRQLLFAQGCRTYPASSRPAALQALTEYDDLLYRLYGKRHFRPFHI